MSKEKLQEINKKQRIVLSAHDLFLENGFMNTSINSIQEKAGISKGLIYYHFDNKDELALAVLKYVFDQEFESFDEFTDKIKDISNQQMLMQFIDTYLHQMFSTTMQERSTFQIIIDLLLNLNSTSSKKQVRELYQGYLNEIAQLLSMIGVDKPNINAKLIFSILDGLMYLNMALGETLTEDENNHIIKALKCIINLEDSS